MIHSAKSVLLLLTLLFGISTITTEVRAEKSDNGWIELFDGKSLDQWFNPYDWGEAVAQKGEIQLHTIARKFFLMTKKTYSDFIFEAEVKLPEGKANSGFMFRAHFEPNRVWGYQAEVDPSSRAWSGGLYDEGRRGCIHPKQPIDSEYNQKNWTEEHRSAFKQGEWNRYKIHCEGNRIRIYLNDVLTTDLEDDLDQVGRIGLQHHGEVGRVYRFRNLRLKELLTRTCSF